MTTPNYRPQPPRHRDLEIRVVPLPGGGFQPFLIRNERHGFWKDMLPIQETPPLPTYREAEELAIRTAWEFIDGHVHSDGTAEKSLPLSRVAPGTAVTRVVNRRSL